ncbi:helix-turn-helix domain-containing protein [Paenibacillus larvae]|uniref:helix-turn-helix domain-containing protein n=1 Tax=Paenibacillus larvae TaxID=1464 RepID=UPI0001692EF8|nr:helix-turn-helix transcriptional regulator [Paenibacillus larvae]
MSTIPLYQINTLRSLRTKYGYTQKEAAKLLGISEGTLRVWEKNSEGITYSKIKKIEEVYGTPQDYIFFGKESAFSEILEQKYIS